MYKLMRGKFFIKDMRNLRITDSQYNRFIIYIGKLLNKESLPSEAKDHSLKGEWEGAREFHIGGDLVVIYMIDENTNTIELIRIGSHAKLFKKF